MPDRVLLARWFTAHDHVGIMEEELKNARAALGDIEKELGQQFDAEGVKSADLPDGQGKVTKSERIFASVARDEADEPKLVQAVATLKELGRVDLVKGDPALVVSLATELGKLRAKRKPTDADAARMDEIGIQIRALAPLAVHYQRLPAFIKELIVEGREVPDVFEWDARPVFSHRRPKVAATAVS